MSAGQSVGKDTGNDVTARTALAVGATESRDLGTRFSDVVYVADFGALGSEADETIQIQAAIDAAEGKRLVFGKPTGTFYLVTDSLSVPSNIEIVGVGVGGVSVKIPSGSTFDVFDLDGVSNVRLSGLNVSRYDDPEDPSPASVTRYGFNVRGASTDIEFARCSASSMQRGFNVEGWNGTVPWTAARVTFRQCRGNDANASGFGFCLDDVDGVLFDDCHATNNGLDGFKLRRATQNVTVRGGTSIGNGTSGAGDGMDCYAGGDRFILDGFVVESNSGSGVTVKTGPLNEPASSATYGWVRNVQILGLRSRFNTSSGLNLNISNPATLTQPLVSTVLVSGGLFEENDAEGIYCATRNTTILAPLVKSNGQHGIALGARAMDVTIVSPTLINNGTETPGSFDGINIQGTRIRVKGGRCVGVDDANIGQDSDLAAIGTVVTQYAARVTSGCSDVEVEFDSVAYVSGAGGIQVRSDMTSGKCLIRHAQDAAPTSAGVGSVGSIWTRTDATTPEDVLWVKTSGAPNVNTGWQRVQDVGGYLSRTDADYAPGMGSARTLEFATSLTANRTVTLPSSNTYAGAKFRVIRSAGDTGGPWTLDVGGLKTLNASEWCDVVHSGTAWRLAAYGSL